MGVLNKASAILDVIARAPASPAQIATVTGSANRVCIAEALDLRGPERSQLGVPVPLRPDCVTQTFLAWQPADLARGPYTPDTLAWTRRRGWTQNIIGRDHRLALVAMPVFDHRKRAVAVLSISGPVATLTTTPGRVHCRALVKAASSELITECLRSVETPVRGAPARTVSGLPAMTTTRRGTV
ncbi:IclR family transcriptional regulator C-terminal domain-containing protein [Streptomyces sp. NPDC021218]|uniref:IclR family transcriptional regulator domain-containing protein n=1 Tax=Streptomyces sp. NPDC021218 TaxID=3365119 RepID=UPI0037A8FA7E